MSSIIEMPELVLENIIGLLDFRAVLTLRQVCVDFRNFIDDLKGSKLPDSKFYEIRMTVDNDQNIYQIFKDPTLHTSLVRSQYEFIYSRAENSRSFNGKTTNLKNSNIVDVATRDLELVLKFQKSKLYEYCYLNDGQLSIDSSIHTLSVKLSNMFKKFNRKIEARLLTVRTESPSEIMSILPFLEPETLKTLRLFPSDEEKETEINEIVETEQWKKATDLNCVFHVFNLKVEDVSHFSVLAISVLSISASDLNFLKETYISSSNFKRSWLKVKRFKERKELSSYWGPSFYHPPESCWYFRMKHSDENILRIRMNRHGRMDVRFGFIQLRDVPTSAIVQDYNKN